MIKEFVGKTEKDAIQKAADELGLQQDEFDVEIVESNQTGFLFKKGEVKIRVHYEGKEIAVDGDLEQKIILFIKDLIGKMGFPGDVEILFREGQKLCLGINSDHSAILIGRKGKNLDAIQLLANVYCSKLTEGNSNQPRIIVDSENYRRRREDSLVQLASKSADQVVKSRSSRLMDPMNPFERRLIHTTLNDRNDVITKSEGEGLYKRVRIMYKGTSQ